MALGERRGCASALRCRRFQSGVNAVEKLDGRAYGKTVAKPALATATAIEVWMQTSERVAFCKRQMLTANAHVRVVGVAIGHAAKQGNPPISNLSEQT